MEFSLKNYSYSSLIKKLEDLYLHTIKIKQGVLKTIIIKRGCFYHIDKILLRTTGIQGENRKKLNPFF